MRYISIGALAVSAPVVIFALLLPDLRLPDKQNLVEGSRHVVITLNEGESARSKSP